MPLVWAYGGGAFDEASPSPTYDEVKLDNASSQAALQVVYDTYVRDKSVPVSALTNTQADNQSPFISGQLGMMISHPSEYVRMLDLAAAATGNDKAIADEVVANMRYGRIPASPAGRAVVFGGSKMHIINPEMSMAARWTSRRPRR